MLQRLMLKNQYRSDHHSIAQNLYLECLPLCSEYSRAVGFFSSSILSACPEAFGYFFVNGGKARIVSSPILSAKDIKAMVSAYRNRHLFVRKDDLSISDFRNLTADTLLTRLVSKGILGLKIAIISDRSARGIFHEKVGLFRDSVGDFVAFSGSANESKSAVISNFEQVDVYCSWVNDDRKRAERKKLDFERLWSNKTPGLEVLSFVEAARRKLLETRSEESGFHNSVHSENTEEDNMSGDKAIQLMGSDEVLQIPIQITLYEHQKNGVRVWMESSGRGILEMATGSGKTITALSSAAKLYELLGPPLFIVIVCPYLHLVDQWREESKNFGLNPLICAHGRKKWYEDLQVRLYNARTDQRQITSVIASNSTFRSDAFQRAVRDIDVPLLFIGDEVHNLGATNLRKCLPENASYRLGLSATPERWFDPTGTGALTDYFGSTLAHYTLSKALEDGVLCPYRYFPHPITLSGDELEEYHAITKKIGRAFASGSGSEDDPSPILKRLLIQRARIVATAKSKLDLLRTLMKPRRETNHILVYCGDGRVEEPGTEEEMRQVRAVTRMLGNDFLMRVAKYTAETPPERRRGLRKDFASGNVQCLVAIRCLDEGVDIPEIEHAFILASSSNPRQFIQRRGRLLRRSPGKDVANIHDFIVVPPEEHRNTNSEYFYATRKLFKNELKRVIEFAQLAVNGPEAMHRLLDVRDQLNLLDIDSD